MADPAAPNPRTDPDLKRPPPRQRPRRFWVVRRRYKVARWVVAALGGLAALALVRSMLGRLEAAGVSPGLPFLETCALLVVLSAAAGWLLVALLWRREGRRKRWDWQ